MKIKYQKSESIQLALFLALSGGFLDAYTYTCRDQVFANAQTGNIVRVGMTIANGQYLKTIRYGIPIFAFMIGILLAMTIRNKTYHYFHWRQVVLMIESIIIIIVGIIPKQLYFNVLANILVSLLCAMQAESFRKVLGNPFSSTMCTGNLRSATECLYSIIFDHNKQSLKKMNYYIGIIVTFIIGAFIGVLLTNILIEKAILFVLLPLVYSILIMNYHEKEIFLNLGNQ
ncbi:MAG: YoaK family protein [Faecalibacillus sp.]